MIAGREQEEISELEDIAKLLLEVTYSEVLHSNLLTKVFEY